MDKKTFQTSQFQEHEENLNNKISAFLEMFEKMNVIIQEYDGKFFDYYEELRNIIIKILNEIVEHYVYKKPEKKNHDNTEVQKVKKEMENLKRENTFLKNEIKKISQIQSLEPEIEESIPLKVKKTEPLKKIEKELSSHSKENKNFSSGNKLLKWKKSKDFNK